MQDKIVLDEQNEILKFLQKKSCSVLTGESNGILVTHIFAIVVRFL